MGKMSKLGFVAVVGIALCLGTSSAQADYVMSIVDAGAGGNALEVLPGDAFSLDVSLASDAQDFHLAGTFAVQFSAPGLNYLNYTWGAPYVSGGDDLSAPHLSALPLEPWAGTQALFSNFLNAGQFESGTIITMDMSVPLDFPTRSVVRIDPFIDEAQEMGFTPDGSSFIPTTGQGFTLTVIPEPATLLLLGIGGVVAMRRRR